MLTNRRCRMLGGMGCCGPMGGRGCWAGRGAGPRPANGRASPHLTHELELGTHSSTHIRAGEWCLITTPHRCSAVSGLEVIAMNDC